MKSEKSSKTKQSFSELVDAARREEVPQVNVAAGVRQALQREKSSNEDTQDLLGTIAQWFGRPVVMRGLMLGSATVAAIFIAAFVLVRPEPVALDHLSMMSNLFAEAQQ